MHSSTARGFCVMLLSRGAREKLRDLEKSLPPGRSFINAEIMDICHLEIRKEDNTKTEAECKEMDELWRQFNREVWKAKKIQRFHLSQARAMAADSDMIERESTTPAPTDTLTSDEIDEMDDAAAFGNWVGMDADERFNWGEYAVAHYKKPRGSLSRMDEAFGMAG